MFDNVWVISIGILSGIIVIKSAWSDVIIPLFRWLGFSVKSKDTKAIEVINNKLDSITVRMDESDKHRETERELQQLILEGVTASLRRFAELGANGTVSGTLCQIEEYKNKKAVM